MSCSPVLLLLLFVAVSPVFSFNQANCKNGGVLTNTGECECTLDYTGSSCELRKCENGGRPSRDNFDVAICKCPKGFNGTRCEDASNCSNGGTLLDGKCTCRVGFVGPRCERESKCYNGGVESETPDTDCICPKGFKGSFCDEEIVCEHGGVVTEENECACKNGWTGERCTRCDGANHPKGDKCIPNEIPVPALMASSSSFADWHIIAAVVAAAATLLLLVLVASFAIRKYRTKPSRVSSAQGEPTGTDV